MKQVFNLENIVILKGTLRDIEYSHTINDVEYNKANLIIYQPNGQEDIIALKFKKYSNKYKNGDTISLKGNLRSYSQKLQNGKNKVNLYVFTYFDVPILTQDEVYNKVVIDGRICKIDNLRINKNGKHSLHFILANNIVSNSGSQKINNYIPTCMWGKLAIDNQNLKVNDLVKITGQLHSRLYKKIKDNNDIEFKGAHELIVTEIEKV